MKLNAETRGQGPELVLLHGWGMSSAVWEGLPADLTLGHRLTLVELPGHGRSPVDPTWNSLYDWARACLDVTPERATWVGWSLGGLVALEVALSTPQRVASLVQISATPRFVQGVDWTAAMLAETLDRFHDGLVADPTGTLHRFLALQVRGSDAARQTLRSLRQELADQPVPDARAMALGLDLLRECDLRARLPQLACPSLWLFGERDTLVPAAAAKGVADLLPTARVHLIQGAAHAPFLSHPAEMVAKILSFLWENAQ